MRVRFRCCYSARSFTSISPIQRRAERVATYTARLFRSTSQRRAYRTSRYTCTQSHPRDNEQDSTSSWWYFSDIFGLGKLQAMATTDHNRVQHRRLGAAHTYASGNNQYPQPQSLSRLESGSRTCCLGSMAPKRYECCGAHHRLLHNDGHCFSMYYFPFRNNTLSGIKRQARTYSYISCNACYAWRVPTCGCTAKRWDCLAIERICASGGSFDLHESKLGQDIF